MFFRKSAPSVPWGGPIGAHLSALGIGTLIVPGKIHQRVRARLGGRRHP